jgi:Xaa-Pro aminopeptidase
MDLKNLREYLITSKFKTIFTLENQKEKINLKNIETEYLKKYLVKLRMIKSKKEIRIMKMINSISSEAFIEMIKSAKPNTNESFYEGMFTSYCFKKG